MRGLSQATTRVTESIERNDTQFGTRIADNTVNVIDVPGTYNYNTDRVALDVNGTFYRDPAGLSNFTDLAGGYELTADPGDTVTLQAREKFRYVPNYEALLGGALFYNTAPDPGQRLFFEFTDDARENGYRYALEPGNTRVEQLAGGTVVDSVPESAFGDFATATKYDRNPFDHDAVTRTRPLNPRMFIGWYGVLGGRYNISHTLSDGSPRSPTIGHTAASDRIATDEINLRCKVVAECATDATAFSATVGSFGGLIRGNATITGRSKNAPFWDLGGSISQYLANNEPVLAGRIDPNRENVSIEFAQPEVNPNGTDVIEVLVGAVPASDTDADFQDPDADGVDEGTSPRAQTLQQNDVLQWTRNVSTFPTQAGEIRRDGTDGAVPDVRYLTTGVGSGGGNNSPADTGRGNRRDRKLLYPDEVALFIPASDPAGNVTGGSLQYLTPFTRQNW